MVVTHTVHAAPQADEVGFVIGGEVPHPATLGPSGAELSHHKSPFHAKQ